MFSSDFSHDCFVVAYSRYDVDLFCSVRSCGEDGIYDHLEQWKAGKEK